MTRRRAPGFMSEPPRPANCGPRTAQIHPYLAAVCSGRVSGPLILSDYLEYAGEANIFNAKSPKLFWASRRIKRYGRRRCGCASASARATRTVL